MSTTKLTSHAYTGSYNTQWATKEDAILKDQYLPKVYHIYGDLTRLSYILEVAGKTMFIPNSTISHFEKYAPNFVFTTLGAIGSGTGSIEFQIATTDYDSLNNPPLRLYETFKVPAKFMIAGINLSLIHI